MTETCETYRMIFELFNNEGNRVGYKRVSSVFGVPYDYSYDGEKWDTPKIPANVLIMHAFSKEQTP